MGKRMSYILIASLCLTLGVVWAWPKHGARGSSPHHHLIVGASQSGKSTSGALPLLIETAKQGASAILLCDPKGTLADSFFRWLVYLNLWHRVTLDDLNYHRQVPGYALVRRSDKGDPVDRWHEEDVFLNREIELL